MAKLSQKPDTYLEQNRYKTRSETVQELFEQWQFTPDTEKVPLDMAAGRISAFNVFSLNTLPICRAAAADGVAVRYSDFKKGLPDFSNWVENVDYASADMGDDFDDAFDTVLWIEDFKFDHAGNILSIKSEAPVKKGHLVLQTGATIRRDELVLKEKDVITPFRLGLLAAAGITEIQVKKQPKIVFVPTGNELIPAGQLPDRGQNIETNSLMAAAFAKRWGAQMECLSIVEDQQGSLERAIDIALEKYDVVLLNGGTSMGTEDYTSNLLEKRASYFQHGVRCIPGVPVAVAIVDGKPVVNLPGPPYAACCALDWCVRALVYHWYGLELPGRQKVKATLKNPIQKPAIHEMYVRLDVQAKTSGGYIADPISWDARYSLAADRWNGWFIAPIGKEHWEAECEIEVELLYTDC